MNSMSVHESHSSFHDSRHSPSSLAMLLKSRLTSPEANNCLVHPFTKRFATPLHTFASRCQNAPLLPVPIKGLVAGNGKSVRNRVTLILQKTTSKLPSC